MPDPSSLVLLTRPQADSEAFASDLGSPCLISPVLRIEPVGEVGPLPQGGGLILTSRHAVARLPTGVCPAFCVGDATAQAAKAKGYAAVSCGGDADALVNRMLSDRPPGPWLHLRGQKSRGDIKGRLTAGGLMCEDRVVYEAVSQGLSDAAKAALQSSQRVIMPLFSPYSARLAMEDVPSSASVLVVAMSEAVASEVPSALAEDVIIAAEPTGRSMMEAMKVAIGRSA